MTTLWIPTPIETTEQISLLPDTAILTYSEPGMSPIALVRGGELDGLPVWEVTGSQQVEFEARLIGWGAHWIALTPTEAEQEHQLTFGGDPFGLPMNEADARKIAATNASLAAGVATRLVTPWQPVDAPNDLEAPTLADCGDQA